MNTDCGRCGALFGLTRESLEQICGRADAQGANNMLGLEYRPDDDGSAATAVRKEDDVREDTMAMVAGGKN